MELTDEHLQHAIDNAEAWLDNCEECRFAQHDCWLCDDCKFWKREKALLLELQQRRAQRCETCASWEFNYCPPGCVCYKMGGLRSPESYCSEWRQLGGNE